jgi:hypothetical protein
VSDDGKKFLVGIVTADRNITPSSGCCFHATSDFVHDLVELLLLLLLLLTFSFLGTIKFQLVAHAALSVSFFSFCMVMFSCQFCFFRSCRIDA